jgi:hypothetical protein
MNFPSLLNATPGDSSQPATRRPTIIESAPAARALHIFPEFLFPPSEHKGTSYYLQTGTVSKRADSCGTPLPATILVIQMLPFPIPHRIPSAPLLIRFSAPSPEAIDPATISIVGNFSFNSSVASIASLECPFATSTTRTSHPASTNFLDLYK